ncbi:hypothetical protein R6Q59_008839 [Mikania micrantha]
MSLPSGLVPYWHHWMIVIGGPKEILEAQKLKRNRGLLIILGNSEGREAGSQEVSIGSDAGDERSPSTLFGSQKLVISERLFISLRREVSKRRAAVHRSPAGGLRATVQGEFSLLHKL